MAQNVLLTGGSGFIGKKLCELLIENGYTVSILSRSDKRNSLKVTYYKWDIEHNYIEEKAVLSADYIIHLAGEGIVDKRWTSKRKKEIIDSRTKPIELIYSVLKENNKTLKAFISASAIGIYGSITSENICTELTSPAKDFLGITCTKWEAATIKIAELGIRTVKIRTGLVLGKNEGLLKKLAPIFKAGFGSALGTGNQYFPWIHIDDLCSIYLKAIVDDQIKGAYNAAINDSTTNLIFSQKLAAVYGRKLWLPKVPSFLIKLAMGEMSETILKGQRVSSDKIEKTGFQFRFKKLEKALSNCLN